MCFSRCSRQVALLERLSGNVCRNDLRSSSLSHPILFGPRPRSPSYSPTVLVNAPETTRTDDGRCSYIAPICFSNLAVNTRCRVPPGRKVSISPAAIIDRTVSTETPKTRAASLVVIISGRCSPVRGSVRVERAIGSVRRFLFSYIDYLEAKTWSSCGVNFVAVPLLHLITGRIQDGTNLVPRRTELNCSRNGPLKV